MTSTNYNDLSIKQILALAESEDLDEMQLASRLARRLALDLRRRLAALNRDEQVELESLEQVTDHELFAAAAVQSGHFWQDHDRTSEGGAR
jgi:hypothetical protein